MILDWVSFQNEMKNRFEGNLFWKNFSSYKDWSLQLWRIFYFSIEISVGFVWYVNNSTAYVTLHNNFLGNQEVEVVEQNIFFPFKREAVQKQKQI